MVNVSISSAHSPLANGSARQAPDPSFADEEGALMRDFRDAKAMAMQKLLKRYAGTRLYHTEAARYVTLAELRAWFAWGVAFGVIDAETGQDTTRALGSAP
jgi:hypothetical protein